MGEQTHCPNVYCGALIKVSSTGFSAENPRPMKSLPGERVLYKAPGGRLIITTHRVRYERQSGGTTTIKGIMLEEVASCAMIRKTYPWLLIWAAFSALGGLLLAFSALGGLLLAFSAGVAGLMLGMVLALVLGLAYLLSREQVVAIASPGATIFLNLQGWSLHDARELIEQVEAAKNARYLVLRGQPAEMEGMPSRFDSVSGPE
jgi:hypothetical protein